MKEKEEEYKVGDKFFYIEIDGVEIAEIKRGSRGELCAIITYARGLISTTEHSLYGAVFSRFKNNRLTPLIKELL